MRALLWIARVIAWGAALGALYAVFNGSVKGCLVSLTVATVALWCENAIKAQGAEP